MGLRGGMFDFSGHGGPALLVVVLLAAVGLVAAIRGYWGDSGPMRRLAVVVALLTLPVGFAVGGLALIDGYDRIAMLGPAATPADEGYVWRRALSPAIAACIALSVVLAVAGAGWIRERGSAESEPPPRKPAR